MNEDQILFLMLGISELISLILFIKILLSNFTVVTKLIYSFMIFIPLLGPVFYLMMDVHAQLSVQPLSQQNRIGPHSSLWGWGSYTEKWQLKKDNLERNIKNLQDEENGGR